MTRSYPPPTPDELTALDMAIQRNDCDCGRTTRVVDMRAGIDAQNVQRCTMHAQLLHDPQLLARLVGQRRDAPRLGVEESDTASLAERYHNGERRT